MLYSKIVYSILILTVVLLRKCDEQGPILQSVEQIRVEGASIAEGSASIQGSFNIGARHMVPVVGGSPARHKQYTHEQYSSTTIGTSRAVHRYVGVTVHPKVQQYVP